MFRRHAIPLLVAILVVGVALPFSTPFVLVALVPLYWIARRPRAAGAAVGGGRADRASRSCVEMDDLAEPVSTARADRGPSSAAARYMVAAPRGPAARERELLAEAAAAEERLRIARELHDAVGHDVSLMVVQAEALGAVTGDERADAIAALGPAARWASCTAR